MSVVSKKLFAIDENLNGHTCQDTEYECYESGRVYNGITDAVANLLTKPQHVTVSENSDHKSCVSLTVVWTGHFLHSRQM